MLQVLTLARQEWIQAVPALFILLIAMLLDVIMGLLVAINTKQLSSSVSWKGITKKAGVLVLITFASALDPLVPVPLTLFVTLAYILPEGISLLEKGAKLGITKNKALVEGLAILRKNTDHADAQKVEIISPVEMVEHKSEEKL